MQCAVSVCAWLLDLVNWCGFKQAPWYWILYQLSTSVAIGGASLGAATATIFGSPLVAKPTVVSGLVVCAVFSVVAATAAAQAAGDSMLRESLPPVAAAVSSAILALGVTLAETWLLWLCTSCGTMLLAVAAGYYTELLSDAEATGTSRSDGFGASAVAMHVGLLEGIFLLLASTFAVSAYQSKLQAQHRILVAEQACRMAICEAIIVLDAKGALPAVQKLLLDLKLELPASAATHGKSIVALARARGIKRAFSKDSTQESLAGLDDILLQASVAAVALRRKATEWGKAARGYLPIAASGDSVALIACDSVARQQAMSVRVLWPKVASQCVALRTLGRAAALGHGPALPKELIGCCRAAVYLEELTDVLTLLEVIRSDPDARILSLRDRLCDNGAKQGNSGLGCEELQEWENGELKQWVGHPWCVAVGVRVCSDETRRLGLDAHVGELWLCLSSNAGCMLPIVSG